MKIKPGDTVPETVNLILNPIDPTGTLQIFTGKRPDSPDDADKSNLLLEIPVKTKEPAMKKTCETCAWEPEWASGVWPSGAPYTRGKCQIPCGHREVKKLRLPSGTTIAPPWIEQGRIKQNCPAWEPKEPDHADR